MLKKKLVIVAVCAASALLGTGVASADPAPAPGPDPNGPKCAGYGGPDGTSFQVTPCGWRYGGDEKGWYQVPPDGPVVLGGQ
jgi:hypothetical protein